MPPSPGEKISVRSPACPSPIKVNVDQDGFATTNGLKLQRDLIARERQPGG